MPKPTPGPRTPGVYGGGATPGNNNANSSNVRISVVPPSGSDSIWRSVKFPRLAESVVLISDSSSDCGAVAPVVGAGAGCVGAGAVMVAVGFSVISGGRNGVIALRGTR